MLGRLKDQLYFRSSKVIIAQNLFPVLNFHENKILELYLPKFQAKKVLNMSLER